MTEETVVQSTPSDKKFNLDTGVIWNAFKNFAIIFSFIVNFILVLALLIAPSPVFMAKGQLAEPLLGDLDAAFAALGETVIVWVVELDDTMPVVFPLPLRENTDVVLTGPVPLEAAATFLLPGGGGAINGTVRLNLPTGLSLPVALSMTVPVSTTIPVVLDVPVNIPLAEAGMGPAIFQLREVFRPITGMLQLLPNSLGEIVQPAPAATPTPQ